MAGFMNWFTKKANQRLRLSQIKILFQNQAAVEFMIEVNEDAIKMGLVPTDALQFLKNLDDDTAVAIIDLSAFEVLPQTKVVELLKINSVLKEMYAGHNEGKRRARQMIGDVAGNSPAFAERFQPARGWDYFSDLEWDRMVSKALRS